MRLIIANTELTAYILKGWSLVRSTDAGHVEVSAMLTLDQKHDAYREGFRSGSYDGVFGDPPSDLVRGEQSNVYWQWYSKGYLDAYYNRIPSVARQEGGSNA